MRRTLFLSAGALALLLTHSLQPREIGLSEAAELARQGSIQLRALRMEEESAELQKRARLREFFPSINASYRRNRTIATRDFDTGNNSLQLSISQPIYDGGRTLVAHQLAEIDLRLSRQKTEETQRQLVLEVNKQYFELLQVGQNVSIVQASVRSYALLQKIAEVEHANGNISLLEYLQIRNQHARRQHDLQAQKDQLEAKQAAFRLFLRIPPDEDITLRPIDLRDAGTESLSLEARTLVPHALENRPDMRRARMELLKNQRSFTASQYSFLPTVALTGSYGKTGDRWPPRSAEWGIGLSVTFNLFGNTVSTDYRNLHSASDTSQGYSSGASASLFDHPDWRQAHLRDSIALMQSRDRRLELERSIENEVQAIRAEYARRKASLAILDEATALQEQKQNVTEYQYRHGEVSFDEYLKQEAKLFESRFSLVGERIAHVLFVLQMELALGLPAGGLGPLPLRELRPGSPEAVDVWRPRTRLPENSDLPAQEEKAR